MELPEIKLAFFFEIIGVFITMFVLKLQVVLSKWFNFSSPAKRELNERFIRLWDKHTDSRYHTWLKVKINLLKYDGNPERLKLVNEILDKESKKQPKSDYVIDAFGRIKSRKDIGKRALTKHS